MKRSRKCENGFVVKEPEIISKKGKKRGHLLFKTTSTDQNYRDIKDWYYGDKYKSLRNFDFDLEKSNSTNKFQFVRENEEQPSRKVFKSNFDLFNNPKRSTKLVLKKTSRNIRLGYKKIMKKDTIYDELYENTSGKSSYEKDCYLNTLRNTYCYGNNFIGCFDNYTIEESNFLCCKEYKKYVENLVISHSEESCKNVHKGKLEYLCEVACAEFSKNYPQDSKSNLGCVVNTKCPLRFCLDTFCSQCNLCMTNSEASGERRKPK
ncbi:hypothetical protein NGRA_1923 [Nosema granulosis]|uniref:Uncharacterized protein n=1 Tax=Nosema granulosis TaxID=83296 RepID=A0A9P6GXK7_9MICR|nr:hypothetical protein NGRA_1923 [Nosema granulosis]